MLIVRSARLRSRGLGAFVGAFLLWPTVGAGQAVLPYDNGRALRGVASFDAQVYIQMWLGVEQDEAQFENNAQAAFELGLRRDGVTIDGASPNLLFCSLRVAERLGQIAYTFSVEYFEPAAAGVRRLAWTMGGMVMGGTGAFSAEGAAKNCVDTFSNEWLKQNPRREEEGR